MTDTNIEVLQRISDGYFPHGAEQRAALDAAITALSARASAGEGGEWVLVPRDAITAAAAELSAQGCKDSASDLLQSMLTAAPQPAQAGASGGGDEQVRADVHRVMDEGDGYWKACSGCYESKEGYDNTAFPYSDTFRCRLGGGCSECGGLGAVWEELTDEATPASPATGAIGIASIPPGGDGATTRALFDARTVPAGTMLYATPQPEPARGEPRAFQEIRHAIEHCASCCDEGEDFSVSRPMLDALVTLGLMKKAGRGRWEITEDGERLAAAPQPQQAPAQEWRCFYCDEVFTDREAATLHFGNGNGYTSGSNPGCQIDLAEYRRMEAKEARFAEEDADCHRALHRQASEHQVALRRAEEAGYAKGLCDSGKCPCATPPAHGDGEELSDLIAKLPSLATLDAVDDDLRRGTRPCPLNNLTINDVKLLHRILTARPAPEADARDGESALWALRQILHDLPEKRDWLDTNLEAVARQLVARNPYADLCALAQAERQGES